jgi:hypothetical protein
MFQNHSKSIESHGQNLGKTIPMFESHSKSTKTHGQNLGQINLNVLTSVPEPNHFYAVPAVPAPSAFTLLYSKPRILKLLKVT